MKKPYRVIWTEDERRAIVAAAADILAKRSDLSGLPLLREAMTSLPIDRRRKLIAVTQAPWFERGLERERRRQEARRKQDQADRELTVDAAQIAPLLRAILSELRAMTGRLDSWIAANEHGQSGSERSPGSNA